MGHGLMGVNVVGFNIVSVLGVIFFCLGGGRDVLWGVESEELSQGIGPVSVIVGYIEGCSVEDMVMVEGWRVSCRNFHGLVGSS